MPRFYARILEFERIGNYAKKPGFSEKYGISQLEIYSATRFLASEKRNSCKSKIHAFNKWGMANFIYLYDAAFGSEKLHHREIFLKLETQAVEIW